MVKFLKVSLLGSAEGTCRPTEEVCVQDGLRLLQVEPGSDAAPQCPKSTLTDQFLRWCSRRRW